MYCFTLFPFFYIKKKTAYRCIRICLYVMYKGGAFNPLFETYQNKSENNITKLFR